MKNPKAPGWEQVNIELLKYDGSLLKFQYLHLYCLLGSRKNTTALVKSQHKISQNVNMPILYSRIIVWLSRNTNKMQVVIEIYNSKVYWRLNMFRVAHRSSSGALNCICSFWFIYPCGDRPLSRPLSLENGRSPLGYINQRLQIQFRAPDDERCATPNMLDLQ
jgi:hypothetical protein